MTCADNPCPDFRSCPARDYLRVSQAIEGVAATGRSRQVPYPRQSGQPTAPGEKGGVRPRERCLWVPYETLIPMRNHRLCRRASASGERARGNAQPGLVDPAAEKRLSSEARMKGSAATARPDGLPMPQKRKSPLRPILLCEGGTGCPLRFRSSLWVALEGRPTSIRRSPMTCQRRESNHLGH